LREDSNFDRLPAFGSIWVYLFSFVPTAAPFTGEAAAIPMSSLAATAAAGFAGVPWAVHKFGGTSVADAKCFAIVAGIIERQVAASENDNDEGLHLACVVSAMGGKPKTTDLLLSTVKFAATRDHEQVEAFLQTILVKHETCLRELFPRQESERKRLLEIIQKDLHDVRDILKTVALMKWEAARISELVSGYGELWSAQILTSLLQQRQAKREREWKLLDNADESESSSALHPAALSPKSHLFVYLDARRVVTIDEEAIQDGAVVYSTSFDKLQQIYDEETAKIDTAKQTLHFVMTGYVASNTEGVATTLQRDGSDYSAAILGRLLSANGITIWTDVDGVMSADPRRVPLAQVLPEVSFNEAMELSFFGANVIHPKTMQPAITATPQVPIYIRNTFNPSFPGTRIYVSSSTHREREKVVCGFSSMEGMAMVNMEGSGLVGVLGVDRRLFGSLEAGGVNVVLISQASSEHSVTFATAESQAERAKELIEEEFRREIEQNRVSKIEIQAPCSIIAAVGDGMSQTTGVAGRFFSALGDAKINIIAIAQGCSERNISIVVRMEESVRALRAVHAAFRLSHTTIRIGIVGMNELGESLLRLLDSQRGKLRMKFDIDLEVCVVVPKGDGKEMVCLKKDNDGSADSITVGAFNDACGTLSVSEETDVNHLSFQDERDTAKVVTGGPEEMLKHLYRTDCTNHVIFDCTNDECVGKYHAEWLHSRVDVVTANNTGLSGSKAQRKAIRDAEKAYGRQSARYLREVTVGGGLPVIKTLRSMLSSGDAIRRIDGIFSVSLSFIMFRISPPPDMSACLDFDETLVGGFRNGDLQLADAITGSPCSFSEAVKEAIAYGLMEEDPTKDLNNEYVSRVMMVLAIEVGLGDIIEAKDIQKQSDKLLETMYDEKVDYKNLSPEIDQQVKARVEKARSRGCVLRHISSVNVKEQSVEVKVVEVPQNHIFAVTPPSCECVRFFTHSHSRNPVVVAGPSAGVDSTSSALLAELLYLMRGKSSPQSVALSRSGSNAVLHS